MPFLPPDIMLHRVTDIQESFLRAHGKKALFLDVDNTLTTHNNPQPDPAILAWLEEMRAHGIAMMLVSNNSGARVADFARKLRLPYTARACKPLPFGFWRAARALGVSCKEAVVVGDQIFTDIWGGRLFGALSIWVEPIEVEDGSFFRFKRRLETRFFTNHK